MRSLLIAVLGILLVAATVVGIVTATNDAQRPSVGSPQSHSGLVLYGGR
jgi:Protein of unknown function (DUF2613)